MNKWWRKGSQEEDEMVVVTHDLILEAAPDADLVGKTQCATGLNMRDQLTVAQVEEMRDEQTLRRFGWRRN